MESDVSRTVQSSLAIRQVFGLARSVANSTATVLITGESGTGKELVAREIHQSGNRAKGPFIAINCSAIPETLLESELFGYAKGAFTGAADRRRGLFEEAEGGILFLDEIGDLAHTLQAKLLRVLQERKIRRVGENEARPINVRILAATHRDLEHAIQESRFREDLFYRLNVIPIHVPPLRERREDIGPLAQSFLKRFCRENSVERLLSPEVIGFLETLPWRGNVRELENAIEHAVVLGHSSQISVSDFPQRQGAQIVALPDTKQINSLPLRSLEDVILDYVAWVMERVGGVKEKAARILQVDRKTLYRRVVELERRRTEKEKKVA